MALALALIDIGDLSRAREELARGLAQGLEHATPPALSATESEFGDSLADDELESAFAEAETNPDEMMSANRVVEQTLSGATFDALDSDFDVANNPTYATETMASLLADQGRAKEAGALRESLSVLDERPSGEPALLGDLNDVATLDSGDSARESGLLAASVGPDHAKRLQVVATLEGWLHNLRRNAAKDARTRASQVGSTGGAV